MRRVITALTASLLLAAGAVRAEEPWLPLAEGKRWTFAAKTTKRAAVISKTTDSVVTATCGPAEQVEGRTVHRIEFRHDEGVTSVWAASDGDTVWIVNASEDRLPLLPARTQPGALDVAGVRVNGQSMAYRDLVVRGTERVTTPHGAHEALKVQGSASAVGGVARSKTTVWYARGIGPVKILLESEATAATSVTRELLLREVSGGGAPANPLQQGGGATPPPPAPTPPAQGGGAPAASGKSMTELVRAAGDAGAGADLTGLRAIAAEVLKRAERAGNKRLAAAAATWAAQGSGLSPMVVRGLEHLGGLQGKVLVSRGKVEIMGGVKGCVIIATGDIDISGAVEDSLILGQEDLDVAGQLVGSVVAVGKDLDVAGNITGSVVQAGKDVDNVGSRTDATVVPAGADDLVSQVR